MVGVGLGYLKSSSESMAMVRDIVMKMVRNIVRVRVRVRVRDRGRDRDGVEVGND